MCPYQMTPHFKVIKKIVRLKYFMMPQSKMAAYNMCGTQRRIMAAITIVFELSKKFLQNP